MRTLLVCLLLTSAAYASPEDDFTACLVGKAAVALHNQEKKDPIAAQKVAHDACQIPAGIDGDQLDGIGDFVNAAITSMAKGIYE